MKPKVADILSLVGCAVLIACFVLLYNAAKGQLHTRTCSRLEITMGDDGKFINQDDIQELIGKTYGAYIGQRLDSLNLGRMEAGLSRQPVISNCEVWNLDDGTLGVCVWQRVPAARYQNGSKGWYADASGFIFPLQNRYTANVPVVEGDVKIDDHQWVRQTLDLVGFISGSDTWKGNISQIHVDSEGSLTLTPREGKEAFLFGSPTDIKGKFSLMEKYYKSIKPANPNYTTINLKYKNQIICKQ